MQHVRPRANSSPSRPRAGTVGNQSMVSSPPVHEHAEQPQPDGTSMQYKTRKSTFPPLAFFSEPAHQSRQSNPLRMFRERLKRPSSAGGAPERSDNSREGSNLTSPKSPRTKGTRARPSTSSGTPERNVAKQSEETLSSRFSMSAARRRRETSVPPAFPVT
ncbi:hypothetical protein BDY19DRAFT_478093 [Irpex rosettiformis]|uniref:Uncharacterized protein n=1 Tax=Irpex rosettiformis TaxID=378272 RepID=A0ACB8TSH9_9APHY|nr:hypothetical protein BDY19DRAFT_478093 [Irpex rosettiformis]